MWNGFSLVLVFHHSFCVLCRVVGSVCTSTVLIRDGRKKGQRSREGRTEDDILKKQEWLEKAEEVMWLKGKVGRRSAREHDSVWGGTQTLVLWTPYPSDPWTLLPSPLTTPFPFPFPTPLPLTHGLHSPLLSLLLSHPLPPSHFIFLPTPISTPFSSLLPLLPSHDILLILAKQRPVIWIWISSLFDLLHSRSSLQPSSCWPKIRPLFGDIVLGIPLTQDPTPNPW